MELNKNISNEINYKETADKYFNQNNYEEAINYYTTALNNDDKFKIYMNRCLAYYKLSKFDLALEDAIKATKLDTTSGKAWSRVGSCLLSLKKYYPSLSAFEKAKELEPENELYKNLYENVYDTIKTNKILEEYEEDTEDEDNTNNKNNTKIINDEERTDEEITDEEITDETIDKLTNKLKNLKSTDGLENLLKDNDLNIPADFVNLLKNNDLNIPSNFVNNVVDSMRNNKNLKNKLNQKDFRNKVVDYQKNPLAVFNDAEMMDLMNDIINKIKFDQ
jgi:tetratricopeptide (TPR) repeat protein